MNRGDPLVRALNSIGLSQHRFPIRNAGNRLIRGSDSGWRQLCSLKLPNGLALSGTSVKFTNNISQIETIDFVIPRRTSKLAT
jgi:hypothetical protein